MDTYQCPKQISSWFTLTPIFRSWQYSLISNGCNLCHSLVIQLQYLEVGLRDWYNVGLLICYRSHRFLIIIMIVGKRPHQSPPAYRNIRLKSMWFESLVKPLLVQGRPDWFAILGEFCNAASSLILTADTTTNIKSWCILIDHRRKTKILLLQ